MRTRLGVVSAVVLLACVALGVVLFVRQSTITGLVRASAEARLSAALGQPITIGEIGFTLAPRPAFTGSGVRVGLGDSPAPPALRIDRILVVPRFRSFFSDTVRIEEVRLDGFTVSLLRDRNGWHVPAAFPAPTQGTRPGVVIERVHVNGGRLIVFDAFDGGVRETSSIDEISADMLIDGTGLRLAPLAGRVGSSRIDGEGTADAAAVRLAFNAPSINDADLPALLGLLGAARPAMVHLNDAAAASVTVTIDRARSRLSGSGTIRVPALTVEPLQMQRVESPFTIDGSTMTFDPTTFMLNGGTHRGRVRVALDASPARWSSDSQLDGVDVGALLDALAGRDARIDGRGAIRGKLQGRVEKDFLSGLDGRVRLDVVDGTLHDFPLLATINRALRLAEAAGNDTRFERLSATLAIAQAAATDDLVIDARDLRVQAAGRIGFDGALNLRGLAMISADRVSAAVASVHELARAKNSRGEIELPLIIAGTLGAPRFEVDVETALRRGVRDELMRRLRGLIRRPPDE